MGFLRNKKKRRILIIFLTALFLILLHYWDQSDSFKNKFSHLKDIKNSHNTSNCTTIHVTVVCTGYASSRQIVTLLKSILFYRSQPLHFHIIVDKTSEHILTNLFRTWNIPNFFVSFYMDEFFLKDISWINNSHYSGINGLLKLRLPDILSNHIDKVIALDTDLLFNDDITFLYHFFSTFNESQCIGLAENLSEWYLGKQNVFENVWPAIGRGFNTGVILLDLLKLKSLGWNSLWTKVTKKKLLKLKETQLGDQDIFNAVIYVRPTILYQLPCVWNYQLSDNMKKQFCNVKRRLGAKIYHWNSPKKLNSRNSHVLGAKIRYQRFLDLNGALVKDQLINCKSTNDYVLSDDQDKDLCQNLIQDNSLHRVHLYYLKFEYENNLLDVSIVVQLSIDRLTTFEKLCQYWPGPISVAVFTSDQDAEKLPSFVQRSATLSERKNIGYHLVFQSSNTDIFPINLLRNIALQQALTEFVFLCDVDFIPMSNLYSYILKAIQNYDGANKVYIIPAFESLYYKASLPKTKSELNEMFKNEKVTSFRSYVWEQGHLATNFSRWFNTEVPYKVEWQKDFEPYIVIKKESCPLYDKQFTGFGWNKVTHIMELDAAGFEFVVLPDGFIIHVPHEPSLYLLRYRNQRLYRKCLYEYKMNFIKYLEETYTIKNPNKYKQIDLI